MKWETLRLLSECSDNPKNKSFYSTDTICISHLFDAQQPVIGLLYVPVHRRNRVHLDCCLLLSTWKPLKFFSLEKQTRTEESVRGWEKNERALQQTCDLLTRSMKLWKTTGVRGGELLYISAAHESLWNRRSGVTWVTFLLEFLTSAHKTNSITRSRYAWRTAMRACLGRRRCDQLHSNQLSSPLWSLNPM